MRIRGRTPADVRCEAALADNEYHRKWTDMRCAYHRMFRVNGKDLCSRHASIELLHLALKEGRVTRIPPEPRPPYGPVPVIDDNWKPKGRKS